MKLLFDANLWFELLLQRARYDEVRALLDAVPGRLIGTTDFAIHAFALYVIKRSPDVFTRFISDLLAYEIGIVHLPLTSMSRITEVMRDHRLDFDDALQYTAAERFDLKIVSFDVDFDRTRRGRLTPAQALAELAGGATP